MTGFKTWAIGEVLTASDLNNSFAKVPFASAAFTATQSGALAINTGATLAVVFPASRFSVAPIVTVTTNSTVLTPYISAVNAGTVTVGVYNNGAASSGATTLIYGIAMQMASGTAAG